MKAVVIGAGASGICSALMLARYGHDVVLLEAGRKIAPLLRGFSRSGLQFDTGFHQAGNLDKAGVLRKYMNFIGIREHLEFTPLRNDCCEMFRFFHNGEYEDICIPQSVQAVAEALSDRWPHFEKFIQDFFQDTKEAYHHSLFTDPRRMTAEHFGMPSGKSLAAYMNKTELPGKLYSVLTARSIYYGTPPDRCLFEELALVTYSMLEGVHGIKGGGASLAAAFEHALAASGVKILTSCVAKNIVVDSNKKISAVLTEEGELVSCDYCIYTGHPSHLPDMLPLGSLRPAMTRHLLSLEETPKFFMAFGSSKSNFLAGRDLLLCMSEDINKAYRNFGLDDSWVHMAAGTPDGNGNYPIFIGTGANSTLKKTDDDFKVPQARVRKERPQGYQAWKSDFENALHSHVTHHVPELSDLVMHSSASEHSMADWVYGSTGSIYGVMHSSDNMPVLPFTRLNGFLLAGQNVVLPGLLGTFISAAVACGSVVGYKKLFRDLACTNAE